MKSLKVFLKSCTVLCIILAGGFFAQQVFASNESGFLWGVSGHGYSNNSAYPQSKLTQQIQKAKGLGIDIYRINVAPGYSNGVYDWSYMDNVVNTAEANGLKLYVVLYSELDDTENNLFSRGRDIAARYGSRIAYYQIGNEIDCKCIKGSGYEGSSTSDYNTTTYGTYRAKMVALANGLSNGYASVKRVVNLTYKHTGFLELLNADDVPWETTAIDWYSNMPEWQETINKIGTYEQQEIIISECNAKDGTMSVTEQQQADYITRNASDAFYFGHPKLHGFIVYELLDEQFRRPDGEGYYGIVNCDSSGNIGAEKIAYGAYKSMISAIKSRTILIHQSFDDYTTGSSPQAWTVTNGSNTSCTIADTPSSLDKSIQFYDNSGSALTDCKRVFAAQTGTITAEWKFMENTAGRYLNFLICSGSTPAVEIYTVDNGPGLVYKNAAGSRVTILSTISSNTWYRMKVVVNPSTRLYDIYVNDSKIISGAQFRNSVSSVDTIEFCTNSTWTTNASYIDDVGVFK